MDFFPIFLSLAAGSKLGFTCFTSDPGVCPYILFSVLTECIFGSEHSCKRLAGLIDLTTGIAAVVQAVAQVTHYQSTQKPLCKSTHHPFHHHPTTPGKKFSWKHCCVFTEKKSWFFLYISTALLTHKIWHGWCTHIWLCVQNTKLALPQFQNDYFVTNFPRAQKAPLV